MIVEALPGLSLAVVVDAQRQQCCEKRDEEGMKEAVCAGQTLRIVATDPGSVKDFQAFAKQTGNELVESAEAGGEYTFLIKKKA